MKLNNYELSKIEYAGPWIPKGLQIGFRGPYTEVHERKYKYYIIYYNSIAVSAVHVNLILLEIRDFVYH